MTAALTPRSNVGTKAANPPSSAPQVTRSTGIGPEAATTTRTTMSIEGQLFGMFTAFTVAFVVFGWRGDRTVQIAGVATVAVMFIFGLLWGMR